MADDDMSPRTIEVEWVEQHTTVFEVKADGWLQFVDDTTPGREIKHARDSAGVSTPTKDVLLDRLYDEM